MKKSLFIGALTLLSSLSAEEWHSSQLWFKDYNNPYPNTNYTYQLHAHHWHFLQYDYARFNDSWVTPMDHVIELKIRQLMSDEHLHDAENIAVRVDHGKVYLRGTVHDKEHFDDIVKKIQAIEGVDKFKSYVIIYHDTSFEIP